MANSGSRKRLQARKADVRPQTLSSSKEWLPPTMSELRVVLLGNSWSQRCSVGNLLLGETVFNRKDSPGFLRASRQLENKEVALLNTPDPSSCFFIVDENANSFCDPGPHVFLLVLQPEDFSEEHKLELCRVLKLFGDRSFDHSLILIWSPAFTQTSRQHPPLKDMMRKCHGRFLWQKNLDLPELLTRLGQVVKENNGEHLSSYEPRGNLFHI